LCDLGPSMLVNDEPYTYLTPEKIHDLINIYRNKSDK